MKPIKMLFHWLWFCFSNELLNFGLSMEASKVLQGNHPNEIIPHIMSQNEFKINKLIDFISKLSWPESWCQQSKIFQSKLSLRTFFHQPNFAIILWGVCTTEHINSDMLYGWNRFSSPMKKKKTSRRVMFY